MTIYIALLRGINVGGHHKVKMAELRQMFESMGLGQVKTYIQSGNVLFTSELEETELRDNIEQTFEETYGYPVSIILRTAEELEKIMSHCPFSTKAIQEADAASDAASHYVALLPAEPSPEAADAIKPFKNAEENYVITGRDVYLLFHQSIRDSKLALNLKKLGVPSTVRNWKTMTKLTAMAKAMMD